MDVGMCFYTQYVPQQAGAACLRLFVCTVLALVACSGPKRPAIVDLSGRENLSFFTPGSLRGTRDGDRLDAQAMFTDSSSILTMDLHFLIGSPTTLKTGAWRWARNNGVMSGAITARSVEFLGGQSGAPSIGGAFDLLGPDGTARYRVTIPIAELKARYVKSDNR
jgi:hypothetical protein